MKFHLSRFINWPNLKLNTFIDSPAEVPHDDVMSWMNGVALVITALPVSQVDIFDTLFIYNDCSDSQSHPPTFFKHHGDFGTRSWVMFRRLYVWYAMKICKFRRNYEKLSWKLENVVTTIYKTISNIIIVFSYCLQMRYTYTFALTLVGKVTIAGNLRKIHFSKFQNRHL